MSDLAAVGGLETLQKPRLSPQENARLQKAAAEFEAIFLKQMLTSMRRTIPKSQEGVGALFKESQGEKIFRDLLDDEYAKLMSQRKNSSGLKESILKQVLKQTSSTSASGKSVDNPQSEVMRLQSQSNSLNALHPMSIKGMIGDN